MKIEANITIYEIGGVELTAVPVQVMKLESHWNHRELVVLHVGQTSYTVDASELQEAVKRCSHWR